MTDANAHFRIILYAVATQVLATLISDIIEYIYFLI